MLKSNIFIFVVTYLGSPGKITAATDTHPIFPIFPRLSE